MTSQISAKRIISAILLGSVIGAIVLLVLGQSVNAPVILALLLTASTTMLFSGVRAS